MLAGEEGGATPAKDPASEASTMFCITDFLQHLDSDFNAGGNFRDSFCSNASTDAGGELCARESAHVHGASASAGAGQDEGESDAGCRGYQEIVVYMFLCDRSWEPNEMLLIIELLCSARSRRSRQTPLAAPALLPQHAHS